MNNYDYIFIFFIAYASITVIFSYDILSGFRMILGSLILLFCYFIIKFFLIEYILFKNISIHKIMIPTAFIFISISLILYLLGFIKIGGNFIEFEHIRVWGIYVERAMPRLIGLNFDPNIFVFSSLILFYYLYFLDNKSILVYLLLFSISLLIVLTISTAGLISIAIPLFLYYFYKFIKFFIIKKYKISIKSIFISIFMILFFFYIFSLISTNEFILNILEKRINNLDSGSGRFEIWSNALILFQEHPVFGIGWYNFLEYNKIYFDRGNYMHNTFLEALVELGIVGFLIYILFFVTLFIAVVKIQSNKNNKYLFFTFLSMLILLNSLSLYINEMIFVFMAFVSYELYKIKNIVRN
ncbi:O-antigen ligase family protein [Arcobacter sp. AHV-9/2010]|uniref:O-antigen ligase family protein n=1 Tax=Arcobacter sp. AHV-9/2010 TaxID=2021861 RepID=UPI0013E90431|nr:O-antigen ligase family protein [Arcobacter sp. CECT 9299]